MAQERDSQGSGGNTVPSVVFLCIHNAGRSQMAAGWLRHLAEGRVDVASGGSSPGAAVNPAAIAVMAEIDIDIADRTPQPWTDETVRSADVVVTMGCGDTCPVFPGVTYQDWAVADPHGQDVEAVRLVRDDIGSRVRHLLQELKIDPS